MKSLFKKNNRLKTLWSQWLNDSANGVKPWKRAEVILVVGALVTGIGSAALSEANRDAANQQLLDRFQVSQVLVASKDMVVGSLVDGAAVKTVDVLQSRVTANMVGSTEGQTVIGHRLLVELKKGDPILLTNVEGTGLSDSIASRIPPGKRLVTLKIKDAVASHGWVKPNDHIDIIANLDLPTRGHTTFTLLEDISLVTVGKATVWEDGKSSSGAEVGFFADPRQVEFINFAQKHGDFAIALRNPKDIKQVSDNSVDLGNAGVDMTNFLDSQAVRKASGGGDLPVYVKGKRKDGTK